MTENKHKSCDECRRRKLKCSGDQPGPCSRCRDEGIGCFYSVQKTMGRPRKRPRSDGEDASMQPRSSNFEIDLASQPLPSIDDWTVQGFDLNDSCDTHPISPTSANPEPAFADGFFQPALAEPRDADNNVLGCDLIAGDTRPYMRHASETYGTASHHEPYEQPRNRLIPSEPSNMHATGQQYSSFQQNEFSHNKAAPCNCLSAMYLAASNLENTANEGFPVALVPIRAALQTARSILVCERCPERLASGRQNVSLLVSLMGSIASGLQILLSDIDAETGRARGAGETKIFDSGDVSATNTHLHTGTPDCPGRMALELEPDEWQTIVRRAVKKHAFKQRSDALSLEALVNAFEERQRAWHRGKLPCRETDAMTEVNRTLDEKDWVCLKFTQGIRQMLGHIQ